MIHSFDTDVAKKYGIPAAILLQHFAFWIAKNEANDQNYYDGNYWTYNSVKAFETLFPYLSTMQIRSALKKLVDEGLVITGNYNQMKYDRTLWYALTEKGKSICYSDKIHLLNLTNGSDENNKPIPDIIPYIDTDINTDNKNTMYSSSTGVDPQPKITAVEVVNLYHEICKSYPRVRSISDNRRKAINARLRTHSMDEIREVFEKAENSTFLKGGNKRNWSANFDWLMNDTNFCKVLDGNYDDKQENGGGNNGNKDGYLAEVEAAFRKCEILY